MRNTKYKMQLWLLAGLMILSTASCNKDYLDKNPLNSVSSENFWRNEADVKSALTGVYSRLQQNYLGYERVYLDGLSDNAYMYTPGNQAGLYEMTIGTITPNVVAIQNMYSTPYRAIASCNFFLDNVDKAPITEAQKKAYNAEVRFIRALSYFDLVQFFGGVIIYDHFPKTLESAKIAKSTKEQVYAFIEADLDYAIASLPDDKYSGRVVKSSVQGLKVRVLLTQEKWAAAAALAQEIMNSGKYILSNNYASLFKTAGQALAAVNTEIMFSTQYLAPNNVHRTTPGMSGMNIEIGWWSTMQPYADLVNDYEMKDGKMASESALFDPQNPYNNRDPRLDLTVKLPGEVWKNSTGAAWAGSYVSNTGFLFEKYVDLSLAPFTSNTATSTDQDFIHLRYADILLMYAEAKNEVSGPDASIYAAINQVRGRTGIAMPAVDQSKYNTKEKIRDFIRHERRIEFAMEGQRYNDLKRWKIAQTKLPTLKTPTNTPMVFATKNYVLPFQTSELDNNPNLVQNEGY